MIRSLVMLIALLPVAAQAKEELSSERKVAMAANALGMQRYRAGELAGAAEQFRVAIEFDKDYVVAHYNLACVASRMGDLEGTLRQLRWLAASADPGAKAKLAKAARDPDLDFVSALPEVRKLVGAPAFEKMRPSQWLMERNGVWSAEAGDCEERTYSLRFGGDGSVALEVKERCGNAAPVEGKFWGRLELEPLAVAVSEWKAWPGAVPLAFESCAGMEAPGSCFVLSNGKARLGPFHRGKPIPKPLKKSSVAASAATNG